MDLAVSETITLGQAFGETNFPYVSLAAEWPHKIEMVNQLYSDAFGVAVQDVVNKSATQ